MTYEHGHLDYNDNYETCERTLAELRIYGIDLDPKAITDLLGIQPSSFRRRGDRVGKVTVIPTGSWCLSSEYRVSSLDLRRHVDWLLDILRPHANTLSVIQQMSGVTMYVTCVWWSKFGDGGPTLCPMHMKSLAELSLECRFELAFFGNH